MWPSAEHYEWLLSEAFEKTKPQNTIPVTDKCPFGCGTCARHERRGTLLEIEVTRNCNLHCPVCFMSAETGEGHPTPDDLGDVRRDCERGGNRRRSITGGEPTCRKGSGRLSSGYGPREGLWGPRSTRTAWSSRTSEGYLEDPVSLAVSGVKFPSTAFAGRRVQGHVRATSWQPSSLGDERCREVGIQVLSSRSFPWSQRRPAGRPSALLA